MAITTNLSSELCVTGERVDLGQKFLRFSVIALMSISIVAPVVRVTGEFWIKVDQLLLPLVLVVYLWLLLVGVARPFRPNGLVINTLVFTICIGSSMLYGSQVIGHPLLARDFFELVKPFFPLIFFTMAFEADFSEESLRMLLTSLTPSILVICFYAFGQWLNMGFTAYLQPYYSGGLHDDGGLAHYRRVYSTLSNPNFLGMLMTWSIAASTLAALFRVGSRFWNVLLLLACLATLTMTGSRYGLIDTVLAFLLIFVMPTPTRRSRRRRRIVFLCAMPVVLIAVITISASNPATLQRFQQLRNPLQENSLRMRLDGLWKDATDQFLQSPLLGHGPAKIIFSDVYTDSEYLQILKQYGLVGLIPYLCYFLLPLGMIWNGLREARSLGFQIEAEWPATLWGLYLSFVMILTALFMNIGMGTYYNLSLLGFLWMWMGIGASTARRIASLRASLPPNSQSL